MRRKDQTLWSLRWDKPKTDDRDACSALLLLPGHGFLVWTAGLNWSSCFVRTEQKGKPSSQEVFRAGKALIAPSKTEV